MGMSKNKKGLIAVLLIGAVIVTGIFVTRNQQSVAAKKIIKLNGTTGTYAWLMGLEKGFVIAWAKGLSSAATYFTYNGARYNTQGGTKIVGS